MRRFRGTFVPLGVLAASAVLAGCTVYTRAEEPAAEVYTVATPTRVRSHREDRRPPSAYTLFYSDLAPYGQWLDAPVCGARLGYVWRPDPRYVGPAFVPYWSDGEWVSTDQGWVFSSDWAFGPIVFHYGRWCEDRRQGWVWVPGTQWGAAWVDWRYGGGYAGWAPLPPPGLSVSPEAWVFVETPVLGERRPVHYGLPPGRRDEAFMVTRPVTRIVRHPGDARAAWPAGPPPEQVRSRRPVHVVPPRPGTGDRVIVRPRHDDLR